MHKSVQISATFLIFLGLLGCGGEKTARPPDSPPPPPPVEAPDRTTTDEREPSDIRMGWQKPFDVIKSLGDLEEKVVVDLGAGMGYFTFKLLPKSKKVIAVDIDEERLEILKGFKSSLGKNQQEKLDVRLVSPEDPGLIEQEADVILIVNTITYIDPLLPYVKNLKRFLKPGGRLHIVDFKSKHMPSYVSAPDIQNRIILYELEDILEEAGFNKIYTDDTTLDFQYMVTAVL